MTSTVLGRSFFSRPTGVVARELLGCLLYRKEGGERVGGWITETEAYLGPQDLASHSRHGRTDRNASMWGAPGHTYVYFTYGMHWMLNLVSEQDGEPGAVLIRALYPERGLDTMRARRGGRPFSQWTDGPAKLCQALRITGDLDGVDVCNPSNPIIVQRSMRIPESSVTTGPRVGLNSVPEPWRSKAWRYRITIDEFEALRTKEKQK